ncbi:leucine-rich repeat domain-containing protein [Stieleria varia]|uniref:leucine-rich repeat domain-containing protein n=1 Tax=Stieleria varia TaxID=2528005 RepID=UPI0011B70EA9|nr:hypothetical protein [Stieleria varia]
MPGPLSAPPDGPVMTGETRLLFSNGYELNLVSIKDCDAGAAAWDASGTKLTVDSINSSLEGDVAGSEIATSKIPEKAGFKQRLIFFTANLPTATDVSVEVIGVGQVEVQQEQAWNRRHDEEYDRDLLSGTVCVSLPVQQSTADLRVTVDLPHWQGIAQFRSGGGLDHGINFVGRLSADGSTNYQATGDFGGELDRVRVIAIGRNDEVIAATESVFSVSGTPTWSGTFAKDATNQIDRFVVQRRSPASAILLRNIAVEPAANPDADTAPLAWLDVPGQPREPIDLRLPRQNLNRFIGKAESPYVVNVTPSTTLRLQALTSYPRPDQWWSPDGSVSFPPADPYYARDLKFDDEGEVYFEARFVVELIGDNVTDEQLSAVEVNFTGGKNGSSFNVHAAGVNAAQPVPVDPAARASIELPRVYSFVESHDRRTVDLSVRLAVDPWSKGESVPLVDRPENYDFSKPFATLRYEAEATNYPVAFAVQTDEEFEQGDKKTRVYVVSFPPQIDVQHRVVARTVDGKDVKPLFRTHAKNQTVVGFNCDMTKADLILQHRAEHNVMFRRVALKPNSVTYPKIMLSGEYPDTLDAIAPVHVFRSPGGEVFTEPNSSGSAKWLQELQRSGARLRFDRAPKTNENAALRSVTWQDCYDDELALLAPLRGVKALTLDSRHLTDSGLELLTAMTELPELEIKNNRKLTTACLHPIGRLAGLRKLSIDDVLVSGKSNYDATDFDALANLKQLRSLLLLNWDVDDRSLEFLSKLESIRELSMNGTEVTDVSIARISNPLAVEHLEIRQSQISDGSFERFRGSRSLRRLNISGENVSDRVFESILQMPALETLDLSPSQVTDAGLTQLVDGLDRLPRLRQLNLRETRVSREGLDALHRAAPKLRLIGN